MESDPFGECTIFQVANSPRLIQFDPLNARASLAAPEPVGALAAQDIALGEWSGRPVETLPCCLPQEIE